MTPLIVPSKRLADLVLHVVALEPVLDVARRLVGAALGQRAMHAELGPAAAAGLVLLAGEHGLDGAMHQQVGIAPDRRGEVRVGLVAQAEVADVVRAVHRLPQRAQHHGLQQADIGTALDLREQLRVVAGVRVVAAAQRQRAIPREIRAALSSFSGVGPSCTRYSAGCLCSCRKSAAHTLAASMHSSISLCASLRSDRHDLFDLALLVELICVSIVSKSIAPRSRARCSQHLEQRVQVLEVRQQRLRVASRFAAFGCDSQSPTCV